MIENINCNPLEVKVEPDFTEWLQAMKMVAYLPEEPPPDFRRKLWLALAEKYIVRKGINWEKEQEKCFLDEWYEDDTDLGDQIIKDLHRTGSSLCTGPTGSINQAKLKKILIGYARWNPEVGYCQGFNMLGAVILEVMDLDEINSIKVMIFLIEGIFPSGYFNGSLNGLQVDMAVFRDLMMIRLPKLAKHLRKLQGLVEERCCEPPLTNAFTMQWFLTMFCTCLPMESVLRIWDLVFIEGIDILLRTALAIWSLLEDKILHTKSADEFYCKMGTLSTEMLNGTVIDSKRLIEKVVEFGPILKLQQLRQKHLRDVAKRKDGKQNKYISSDEEEEANNEMRLTITNTLGGMQMIRRKSSEILKHGKIFSENRDKINIDMPIFKRQYDRLRDHQRQAHITFNSAVSKETTLSVASSSFPVNKLLQGKHAISTYKGRRKGPHEGAIPPARVLQKKFKFSATKTPYCIGTSFDRLDTNCKSDSPIISKKLITVEDIPAKSRNKSDSSSYSDESDNNSSTSTSLCDEDEIEHTDNSELSSDYSPLLNINKIYFKNEDDNHLYTSNTEHSNLKDIKLSENNNDKLVINYEKNVKKTLGGESTLFNLPVDIDDFESKSSTQNLDERIKNLNNDLAENSSKYNFHWPDSTLNLSPNSCSLNFDSKDILKSLSPTETTREKNIENDLSFENDETFYVNEKGITNKYFERINEMSIPSENDLSHWKNKKMSTYDPAHKLKFKYKTEHLSTEDCSAKRISLVTSNIDNFNEYLNVKGNFSYSENKKSDLACRIIEENSKVLHRISKKNFTDSPTKEVSKTYETNNQKSKTCENILLESENEFNECDEKTNSKYSKDQSISSLSLNNSSSTIDNINKVINESSNNLIKLKNLNINSTETYGNLGFSSETKEDKNTNEPEASHESSGIKYFGNFGNDLSYSMTFNPLVDNKKISDDEHCHDDELSAIQNCDTSLSTSCLINQSSNQKDFENKLNAVVENNTSMLVKEKLIKENMITLNKYETTQTCYSKSENVLHKLNITPNSFTLRGIGLTDIDNKQEEICHKYSQGDDMPDNQKSNSKNIDDILSSSKIGINDLEPKIRLNSFLNNAETKLTDEDINQSIKTKVNSDFDFSKLANNTPDEVKEKMSFCDYIFYNKNNEIALVSNSDVFKEKNLTDKDSLVANIESIKDDTKIKKCKLCLDMPVISQDHCWHLSPKKTEKSVSSVDTMENFDCLKSLSNVTDDSLSSFENNLETATSEKNTRMQRPTIDASLSYFSEKKPKISKNDNSVDESINDRLLSIKNTIKSIDVLCDR